MRKTFIICVVLALLFSLCACSNSTYTGEVGEFSFKADCEYYKPNTPGVKVDGFKNTSESKVDNADDAIKKAKVECTIEYDTIYVSFDNESNIWCVLFYTEGVDGGCQSVYIKDNGLTCYIVYGE